MITFQKTIVNLRIIRHPTGAFRWECWEGDECLAYSDLFLGHDTALDEGLEYCQDCGYHVEVGK